MTGLIIAVVAFVAYLGVLALFLGLCKAAGKKTPRP